MPRARRAAFVAILALAACGTPPAAVEPEPPYPGEPDAMPAADDPPDAAPPRLAAGEHRTTAADGVEIVFHVAGQGPICLVQPGGPGLHWVYLRMPALERHFTLVYVEPAGTGASGAISEQEILEVRYADDLEAVRRAIGAEQIYVMGHSYGGFVAMRYASAHGAHVAGLILYSTSALTDATWNQRRDAAAKAPERKRQPWYRGVMKIYGGPDPGQAYEHDCGKLRLIMPLYLADYTGRQAELDPYIKALRCWKVPRKKPEAKPDDRRFLLAGLGAPTLIVTGRHDWLFGPYWAEVTAAALPGAHVVILEQSGHFAHVEEPDAFAAAVASILE